MEKYIEEYESRDTAALLRSYNTLGSQDQAVARKRYAAVCDVLKRRNALPKTDDNQDSVADETENKPCGFEYSVAKRFINKSQNATSRGIPFTLTLADMRRLMKRKRCYYTGVELLDSCDENDPHKRTLERLDMNEGYTKENTVACSLVANTLKNAVFEHPTSPIRMTEKQFAMFARKVSR